MSYLARKPPIPANIQASVADKNMSTAKKSTNIVVIGETGSGKLLIK